MADALDDEIRAAAMALRTAARREYATRAVLQRLHQQQFRRMVLVAYRSEDSSARAGVSFPSEAG